eukprot:TRINITY_DN3787_c1_g4_i1.p1 TRINITY_DN3787_c1_g4~~TRINITY_DN3787_c1_g4_i1.p1  ORF type:complete len:645 (+),score=208.26 TRINITY_DN3787_c1_g4_i1:156-2090(+)
MDSFWADLPWEVHAVSVVLSCYAFYLITDVYLVPVMQHVTRVMRIPDDVAGATILGACLNAPELFSHSLGLYQGSEVGLGLVMGSFNFNLLCITGCAAVLAPRGLQLFVEWRYVQRDFLFYAFSLVELMVFTADSVLTRGEVVAMIATYVVYVLVCAFTGVIARLLCNPKKRKHRRRRGLNKAMLDLSMFGDESGGFDGETEPLLGSARWQGDISPPAEAADDRGSFGYPPSSVFSGTPHPSRKARWDDEHYASLRPCLQVSAALARSSGSVDRVTVRTPGPHVLSDDQLPPSVGIRRTSSAPDRLTLEAHLEAAAGERPPPLRTPPPGGAAPRPAPAGRPTLSLLPPSAVTSACASVAGDEELEEDIDLRLLAGLKLERCEDDDEMSVVSLDDVENREIIEAAQRAASQHAPEEVNLITFPREATLMEKTCFVAVLPINLLIYATVPRPRHDGEKRQRTCAVLTVVMCLVWLAAISTWMQSSAHYAGAGLGVSDELTGLTIVAMGTSLPNVFAAVSAGASGQVETAVCQALGSNTFDILIAFALPYCVKVLYSGKPAVIQADDVGLDGTVDLGVLLLWGVTLGFSQMKLSYAAGCIFLAMYVCWLFFYVGVLTVADDVQISTDVPNVGARPSRRPRWGYFSQT